VPHLFDRPRADVFLGKVGSDLQKPDGWWSSPKADLPEICSARMQEIYGIGTRMSSGSPCRILTVAQCGMQTPFQLRRVWGGVKRPAIPSDAARVDIQRRRRVFPKHRHRMLLEPDLGTKKGAHDFAQHLLPGGRAAPAGGDYYCRRLACICPGSPISAAGG